MTPEQIEKLKERAAYVSENNQRAIRAAMRAGNYNQVARILSPKTNRVNVAQFRNEVGYHMTPPAYNASKVFVKTGNNAARNISRARNSGKLTNIYVPHLNLVQGPGLNPSTINAAFNDPQTTKKWALVNRNSGNLRAFALGRPLVPAPPNKEYLNLKVLAGFPGYGGHLLRKIQENVNKIQLVSIANKFYKKHGFTGGGTESYYMTWNKSI